VGAEAEAQRVDNEGTAAARKFAPVKRKVAQAAHDNLAQVGLARRQRAGVDFNLGGNLRPRQARQAEAAAARGRQC
jgi:hypothetical protein